MPTAWRTVAFMKGPLLALQSAVIALTVIALAAPVAGCGRSSSEIGAGSAPARDQDQDGEAVTVPRPSLPQPVAQERSAEARAADSSPATDLRRPVGAGACTVETPKACLVLATKAPIGTPASDLVAWLETACDGDLAAGCLRLGQLLERGAKGLPADPARAAELLERACRADSQAACDLLGH